MTLCDRCAGKGTVVNRTEDDDEPDFEVECSACAGTGAVDE